MEQDTGGIDDRPQAGCSQGIQLANRRFNKSIVRWSCISSGNIYLRLFENLTNNAQYQIVGILFLKGQDSFIGKHFIDAGQLTKLIFHL
jgi:hypothetical protein